MLQPLTSRKRARSFSVALLLLGLAILTLTDAWWPGIMLALGLSIGLKQYLLGKTYDLGITLLVFVGTFITVQYDISWKIFLPILFSIGAFYILLRELFEPDAITEEEKEEDLNHEIEENLKK